jgi:hypothetical protein
MRIGRGGKMKIMMSRGRSQRVTVRDREKVEGNDKAEVREDINY